MPAARELLPTSGHKRALSKILSAAVLFGNLHAGRFCERFSIYAFGHVLSEKKVCLTGHSAKVNNCSKKMVTIRKSSAMTDLFLH